MEPAIQTLLTASETETKKAVIAQGFKKTDFDIRKRSFDVNYSGSTVCTVLVQGDKVLCGNVGDSRAIVGSMQPKMVPLETEQTRACESHENGK